MIELREVLLWVLKKGVAQIFYQNWCRPDDFIKYFEQHTLVQGGAKVAALRFDTEGRPGWQGILLAGGILPDSWIPPKGT